MRLRREHALLVLFEVGHHECGERNSVNANVIAAAVGREAMHLEVGPDEALVCGADRQARRFRDDGGVGGDTAVEQGARADAAKLLIHHGSDNHLTVNATLGGPPRGGAHGGDTGFHVGRATPKQASIPHFGIPWRM